MSKPYISVVIPVYNEEASLETLYQRLITTLDHIGKTFEVILVNDGSRDRSSEILKQLHERRPKEIRVVEFNRNYGQHMAIMAGFEHVRGEVVFTMDADLQNFPEDMPVLLEAIEKGHDVVGGIRMNRQDKIWRKFFSRLHNILRDKLTKIHMADEGCMLRAYKRSIVDYMVSCEESSTFIPALAVSLAANPTDVPVRHAARKAGESNYNFYKLIRYNFDFFANFSRAPLEAFTIFGFIIAFLSLILFIYLMAERILHGPDVQGVFTLFAIMYFLVGILLMGLGIVGEYIGRIYEEVRKRPRFIVKHVLENRSDQ
ncbi:MAG: UDP-4-amino-4-deoxy-L-arabinose-oxoglutarate aminotransferase [Gammaproteobacteria bacterium]|nr:UDP-4-amino-4-deoxy-L-arabinose-oxoglutarate aminotransferase [Gammaproteobacteria bacterium]